MSQPPLKPAIFVLDRFPGEEDWTIRLCVSGIDNGSALWLETTIKREKRDEVEAITKQIAEALPRTVYLEPGEA